MLMISIVIPTYNRAHQICEALDSILSQSYEQWECIIVDDHSTDSSQTLVMTYLSIQKINELKAHRALEILVLE